MTENMPGTGQRAQQAAARIQNPYILNFCRVLIEKKGEKLEPGAMNELIDDMYELYENMLGRNMVNALPEDVRSEYLALGNDLNSLNYEKIGEYFSKASINYEEIMKQTMKEFSSIYMKNRTFDRADYSGSAEGAESRK